LFVVHDFLQIIGATPQIFWRGIGTNGGGGKPKLSEGGEVETSSGTGRA
jgi:hypothetical protein